MGSVHFEEIIKIAQNNFNHIGIFTNGLNDKIKNLSLRENDYVIYNFNFYQFLSKEKLFYEIGGKRNFEVQVLKDSNEKVLSKKIIEIASINKIKSKVTLTLDCKSNIFLEKEIVIPKLLYIENILQLNNINFSYDHKLPLCYLFKTLIHPQNSSKCNLSNSGVIDANLNICFCLQHPEKIISLKNNENFIPWQIVINHLTKKYYELRLKCLDKICLNCVFFNTKCNGGCWIPSEEIAKQDILLNTNFPVK